MAKIIVVDDTTEVFFVQEVSGLYTLDTDKRTLAVLGAVTGFPTGNTLNFHETEDLAALKTTLEANNIEVSKINTFLQEQDTWLYPEKKYRATVEIADFAVNHPQKLADMVTAYPNHYQIMDFKRKGRIYLDQLLPADADLLTKPYCKFEQYDSGTGEITILQ